MQIVATPSAAVLDGSTPPSGGRLTAYALIAGVSFVAYILARLSEGAAATALAAFGVSACGWAWLLTRALFDPARHDVWWPRVVAAVLMVSGAVSVLAPDGGAARVVAGNVYALSGSAALVLTFVEVFQTRGCRIDRDERLFRIGFLIFYSALMGASVLAAWDAGGSVQVVCAAVSLVVFLTAVAYRLRRPLEAASRPAPARKAPTEDDARLAERVVRLMEDEAIYIEPNLRLADLAARLGQPEHRVSHAIVAGLGFANVNRLINHHRIERARQLLASDNRLSILQIAFACGFASLGPFNRAFKAATGLTPRAWRAQEMQRA